MKVLSPYLIRIVGSWSLGDRTWEFGSTPEYRSTFWSYWKQKERLPMKAQQQERFWKHFEKKKKKRKNLLHYKWIHQRVKKVDLLKVWFLTAKTILALFKYKTLKNVITYLLNNGENLGKIVDCKPFWPNKIWYKFCALTLKWWSLSTDVSLETSEYYRLMI